VSVIGQSQSIITHCCAFVAASLDFDRQLQFLPPLRFRTPMLHDIIVIHQRSMRRRVLLLELVRSSESGATGSRSHGSYLPKGASESLEYIHTRVNDNESDKHKATQTRRSRRQRALRSGPLLIAAVTIDQGGHSPPRWYRKMRGCLQMRLYGSCGAVRSEGAVRRLPLLPLREIHLALHHEGTWISSYEMPCGCRVDAASDAVS